MKLLAGIPIGATLLFIFARPIAAPLP